MRLPAPLDRLHRRLAGRYEIDDPRPIAREAPYTFHLPSAAEIAAVAPGDLVKLTIRSIPPGREWDAERMWVLVQQVDDEGLRGRLENDPSDMPQLRPGAPIAFQRHQVIDIIWSEDRAADPPPSTPPREYLDRCLVDRCVTERRVPIHYLYREEPNRAREGDEYPDSGWRIRGDYRDLPDAEIDARETEYVAIGRVLNADDSWIEFIDAPVGSAFIRDWDTGHFVADREEDS
jgi:hypothetical protein